jgi:hypothetical protein
MHLSEAFHLWSKTAAVRRLRPSSCGTALGAKLYKSNISNAKLSGGGQGSRGLNCRLPLSAALVVFSSIKCLQTVGYPSGDASAYQLNHTPHVLIF